jgi:hypothetical protein
MALHQNNYHMFLGMHIFVVQVRIQAQIYHLYLHEENNLLLVSTPDFFPFFLSSKKIVVIKPNFFELFGKRK